MSTHVSRVVIMTGETGKEWFRYDGPIASDPDASC
jgi:hypothetical protein